MMSPFPEMKNSEQCTLTNVAWEGFELFIYDSIDLGCSPPEMTSLDDSKVQEFWEKIGSLYLIA